MSSTALIHPVIVHFSIALVIVGFFIDILGLINKKQLWIIKAGYYCMIAGSLALFAGYLSGEFFSAELTGAAGELKEKHEVFAKIAMFVLIAACLFRIYLVYKKMDASPLKWVVLFFYFIAFIFVAISGHYGGELVYRYMVCK